MSETLPELDFLKDGFNTAKLGRHGRRQRRHQPRALAVAWTHQKGQPVLVAGTTEPDRATAVVVTPRPAPDALTPPRTGSAPAASAHAYLPWWGLRKDVKWEELHAGYSQ